jgi:hypothetical protein
MSEQNFYSIEDNQVVLQANKWFDKRVVTTIDDKNKESTLGFLQDKFAEIEKETMVLKAEYINAAEKIKLAGRLQRQKQYLTTVKAIGDYSKLFETIDEMENEIKKLVDENIAKRQQIVADTEAIVNGDGEWKNNTEKISELAKELKALSLVPDPRVEELKNKFDQLRDDFFTKKKGHFEGQEQILLDNLAHKIELCEKAEALAASTDWKKTTEDINVLNEDWKKIGHIPRHRSDELWMRFNHAKDIFFAKKREHYESVKNNQEGALKIKLELIEKAEALKDSRDWKKTTDAYDHLLREWKASGRVNNEMNDEVWNKFNEPRNYFYAAKNAYYSSIKLNLDDNFAKKSTIVTRAEELASHSTIDWESATEEMLELTEDWKKIGRVAKEHGDDLWERFLKAKRSFFDRKDAEREKRRSEGSKALDEKVRRNRSYFNKLDRELQLEEEILWDFQDRLKNLAPGIRSFETQERYESIIADAERKVNFLRTKIKDVKANLDADEKEMRYLTRPFVKKDTKPKENNTSNSAVKEEPKVQNKSEQSEETILSKEQIEVVTVAETVEENKEENSADNVATENNSISIETPVEAEELPIQELKENVSEASTETTAE